MSITVQESGTVVSCDIAACTRTRAIGHRVGAWDEKRRRLIEAGWRCVNFLGPFWLCPDHGKASPYPDLFA